MDEGLKIELGKQGVFVTNHPGAVHWGRRNSNLADGSSGWPAARLK